MIVGIRDIPHDLVERIESGSGEDATLSAEICIAVGYGGINSVGALNLRTDPDWEGDLLFEVQEEDENGTVVLADCCNPIPKLTTSLDAVVSLIEQKFPGWGHCYATGWDAEGNCGGFVSPERTVDLTKAIMGAAKSPARALLAACLRAIQEQAGTLADAHSKNPPEAEHG